VATKIQVRRGSSSEWSTANPVLATGEIGYDTTANKFKIGDGVKTWSLLSYTDGTVNNGYAFPSKVTLPASTTSSASLNVINGTAPTSPVTGDLWASSGSLLYQSSIGLSTIAYLSSNISGTAVGISGTQTQKFVYAAPNASNGVASFRALLASDIPRLDQDTTGSAGNLSGTQTQKFVYAAPNAADGTASFRALVASDIPTLNQNTTGTAAGITGSLYYANNGDFTMTESGQTAGVVTSTNAAVKYFGVGANLAANTTYEIDIYLPLVFTTTAGLQPRLNTSHTNSLTLYSGSYTITSDYVSTSASETTMSANTRAVRYYSNTTNISTSTMSVAALSTSTFYSFKIYIKGIIRTNAAGTWNVFYNPSTGTTTGTTLRDGAYMKFNPVTTGTASPTSIGSFS